MPSISALTVMGLKFSMAQKIICNLQKVPVGEVPVGKTLRVFLALNDLK